MSAFVENTELVPVIEEGVDLFDPTANIMFIKPELNFREEMLLQDELTRIQLTNAQNVDVRFMVGTYQLALMRAYVADWTGPDFQLPNGTKVPCNPTNINRLSPQKGYVKAAAKAVGERARAARQSPDPKSPAVATGSTDNGALSSTAPEPSA